MKVYAPIAFRYNNKDYPFGWQDLPQSIADDLKVAGYVSYTDNYLDQATKYPVAAKIFPNISSRPAATEFGIGLCQVGTNLYSSNGVDWSIVNPNYFYGGYDDNLVSRSANNGGDNLSWQYDEQFAAGRITTVADSTRPIQPGGLGSYYARFEVRPGDDPLGSFTTERAEVSYCQTSSGKAIYENEQSGTVRYSFSTKLDSTWQTPVAGVDGAWSILWQLHGPNTSSPAFALDVTSTIHFNRLTGDLVGNPSNTLHALSVNTVTLNAWIDWVITIKFAKDATGTVKVERRNAGDAAYTTVLTLTNISTLQYNSSVNGGAVGNHTVKMGLYRNAQAFTSIVYHDSFIREVIA